MKMGVSVVTLVTLCSLIGYSAGVGSYDAEGVRELLAELKEGLKEEMTVILKQQNETHQQQMKAVQHDLEIQQQKAELQQKTIVELQTTVYSLLKAVGLNYIYSI